MEIIKVHRCNQAITPRNQKILDLAAMLSIGIEYIDSEGQYMYLDFLPTRSVQMAINSQRYIHKNDVVISSDVFTEILIDVASGIPVNDAMLKHNILVKY